MKKLAVVTLLGTSLCAMQIAKASVTLEQVLQQGDPVAFLESLQDRENVKTLCEAIQAKTFYDKAKAAGIGTIKQAKIVNFCVGFRPEVATLKPAIQKAKPAEAAKEVVKLKPVDLSKKGNAEEEQAALKQAREVILENAAQLGKKAEIEAKLKEADTALKQAQEHYDNLSAVIVVLREDMKGIPGFKMFNPHTHEQDTPEQYVSTLNQALPRENPNILDQGSRTQIAQATELLRQANENLANARRDLEIINREMLDLTK